MPETDLQQFYADEPVKRFLWKKGKEVRTMVELVSSLPMKFDEKVQFVIELIRATQREQE